MSAPRVQVLGVDILRFVAALLVVSLHLLGTQVTAAPHVGLIGTITSEVLGFANPAFPRRLPPIAFIGSLGVQIFFTISGFVIAYSVARSPDVKTFLFHRLLRLLPGLWICTAVSAAIAAAVGAYALSEIPLRILLSAILFPIGPKIDGIVWTLVLEVVFYGYVALINPTRAPGRLVWLGLGMATASLGYWTLYTGLGCQQAGDGLCRYVGGYWAYKATSLSLVQHGGFFALGIFIWSLWTGLNRAGSAVGVGVAVAACVLQLVWTANYYHGQFGRFGASDQPWWVLAAWASAMLFLTWAVFGHRAWDRVLGRWRSAIRLIGLATYPLYLLHIFLGSALIAVALSWGLGFFPALAFGLCGVLAASVVVAQWLEPALRGLLARVGPLMGMGR